MIRIVRVNKCHDLTEGWASGVVESSLREVNVNSLRHLRLPAQVRTPARLRLSWSTFKAKRTLHTQSAQQQCEHGDSEYALHEVDESYVQVSDAAEQTTSRREGYAPFRTMISVNPALGRVNRHIDAGIPKERHVTTMRIKSAHINPRRDIQLTEAR